MRLLWIVCVCALAGCGGDDGEAALECSRSDRGGTYLLEYSERSGDCGPLPDALSRLDDAEAVGEGCRLDAPDRWSADSCRLERAYTCEEPGVGPGVTSSSVAVTEQRDGSGDRLTGLLTIRLRDADGRVLCSGTYDVTATRQ